MSSLGLGFSSWRRRAPSVTSQSQSQSQSQQDDQSQNRDGAEGRSPPRASEVPIGNSRKRSSSISSTQGHREPIRSFIHGSVRDNLSMALIDHFWPNSRADFTVVPIDSAQNARTVREDTAELASYLLSDGQSQPPQSFLQRSRSSVQDLFDSDQGEFDSTDDTSRTTRTIPELLEPPSPEDEPSEQDDPDNGPSVLSNLLRKSPAESEVNDDADASEPWSGESDVEDLPMPTERVRSRQNGEEAAATEHTPLLRHTTSGGAHEYAVDIEGQKERSVKTWLSGLVESGHKVEGQVSHAFSVAVNPRNWDRKAIFQTAVVTPASCLPAVAVGLLLNILDALSYGEF